MKKLKLAIGLIICGAIFLNLVSTDIFNKEDKINNDRIPISNISLMDYRLNYNKESGENLKEDTTNEMVDSEIKQAKDFNVIAENSWMKLSMEADKMSDGRYKFYLFYDWKKRPIFTMNDSITINHDSNLYFDTETAKSFHQQMIVNPQNLEEIYKTEFVDSTDSSKCISALTGIEFKFNLPEASDSWPAYYKGYMTVIGGFTNPYNTSGKMGICYSHNQLKYDHISKEDIDFSMDGTFKDEIDIEH